MSKFKYKKIAIISLFSVLALSVPILANQTPNELQIKTKKLQMLREEVKNDLIVLEKSQKELDTLIAKEDNSLSSEAKSMIDKNYEMNQEVKEKIFSISKLEADTGQVDYDQKLKTSLSTFEVAIEDNRIVAENAPEEMKSIIKATNDKKEKIYGKYLKLYEAKAKPSNELYLNMNEELTLINNEMQQSINDLK